MDLILVARASTAGQKSQQVAALLKKLLKKAGLLPDAPAAAEALPAEAAPTSLTSPLPENGSGDAPAHTPLTTSASEPVPPAEPLQRPKEDDR